jgi:hypothetical protein
LRKRCISFIAIALALLGTVAGCGSSGAEKRAESKPLTKAQFHQRAKALCLRSSHQYYEEGIAISRKLQKEGQPLTPSVEQKIMEETVVPGMERKLKAVRALEPPSTDVEQVDRILTAIEKVVEEARVDPKRFVYRQVNFKHPFHHANELAKGYGLSACARA